MVSDVVEVDLLSMDEGLQLLMYESDQPPDHAMAASVEARAIVRECANHAFTIKCVSRWLGLKHATAGVINSVEEVHEDVAQSLERISATTISSDYPESGDMLYEILNQSLSPALGGKPTAVIKLCFAAFVQVFCKNNRATASSLPIIPAQAANILFTSLLRNQDGNLFERESTFDSHFHDAAQLIPEALSALGTINLMSDDEYMETAAHLQLSHDIMLDYGNFLCSEDSGLDMFDNDSERRWNLAFVSAVYLERKREVAWDGKDPGSAIVYSLSYIVSHMLRANLLKEAALLLKDERYIRGRLFLLGWARGAKYHIKDCEELFSRIEEDRGRTYLDNTAIMVRSYKKLGSILREQEKSTGSGRREWSLYEAGLAYHDIAYSLTMRRLWNQAVSYYKTSHEFLFLRLGEVELVASVMYSLGVVCFEINEFEKSLEFFDKCEQIRLAISGEDSILVALTLHKKGDVLSSMSEYDAAMECYEKALETMQLKPNCSRIQIGKTLQSIGNLHFTKGKLDESLNFFEESLCYKRIELGFNHHDLAPLYSQMGRILYQKNDLVSSGPLLEEGLRLLKLIKNRSDENKVEMLSIQGISYIMKGDSNQGLEMYETALDILKSKLSHKKGEIAALLNSIACEYVIKGENRKAFRFFLESLHVRKKMSGFLHLDTGEL